MNSGLPGSEKKKGLVASTVQTMNIRDTATGVVKKHVIRKVRYRSLINSNYHTVKKLFANSSCLTVNEPRQDKTNNVAVRPAKTQISLGIRPV